MKGFRQMSLFSHRLLRRTPWHQCSRRDKSEDWRFSFLLAHRLVVFLLDIARWRFERREWIRKAHRRQRRDKGPFDGRTSMLWQIPRALSWALDNQVLVQVRREKDGEYMRDLSRSFCVSLFPIGCKGGEDSYRSVHFICESEPEQIKTGVKVNFLHFWA